MRRALLPAVMALLMSAHAALPTARAADPPVGGPLDIEPMLADIKRYESFGVHRYGSPGAAAALDWIAAELGKAGLAVSTQPFTLGRQYEFLSGALTADGRRIEVVPHWWIPEAAARSTLGAAIAGTSGDASGRFARLDLPYDRGAYLNETHRARLDEAFARNPVAVLLTIDHPSGDIFTYNVDQSTGPWPVPVILVAPRDRAVLDAAQRAGSKVTIEVAGSYRRDVESRNVVGRLDRNTDKWLVISTPVTSWFTSTCERGPGIAGFLALARLAAVRWPDVDLVFVATAGHEIGHGGMSTFMRRGVPVPREVLGWAHLGASLGCRDALVRAVATSEETAALVERTFAGIEGTRLVGDKAAIGELREIHAAGFPRFFGMAGVHKYFHTPDDSFAAVDPARLGPIVKAFAETLDGLAKTGR